MKPRTPPGERGAFARRVLFTVRRIPRGRVATYGDVATLAGRPRAARAVGAILRAARAPGVPYHRVVAAGGRLGGFGGFPALKATLLRAEGIPVASGWVRDFDRRRWRGEGAELQRARRRILERATGRRSAAS